MRAAPAPSPEQPSVEMQRLWFATLKKDWSSLAVLPAQPGGPADAALVHSYIVFQHIPPRMGRRCSMR